LIAHLPGRAVLAVSGTDRVRFLNGLVSNDVAQVAPGRAVWAAMLTPQGKYLSDFFIIADGERLLLDCEAAQRDMLAHKLARFRLRADVAIAPADFAVHAAWGDAPRQGIEAAPRQGLVAVDPRLPEAGWRVLAAAPVPDPDAFADWDLHRLRLGLPDGTRDLEPDKSVLLEAGFDELGGISWTKGCYMGQELTARTRYRGLLKRRLLPVRAATPLPPTGTPVMSGAREAGVLRSVIAADALALLRLDSLHAELTADGVALTVVVPAWVTLPEHAVA
jgi:folate-binding protein YgfZ